MISFFSIGLSETYKRVVLPPSFDVLPEVELVARLKEMRAKASAHVGAAGAFHRFAESVGTK